MLKNGALTEFVHQLVSDSNILYTYGQTLLNRPLSNPNAWWSEKYVIDVTTFSLVLHGNKASDVNTSQSLDY